MYMFDAFTIYVGIGIVLGLGGFMLLFNKLDLPGYCRKKYRLNTRLRAIFFTLIMGVILAILISMLLHVLGLNPIITQILEGMAIGFNCAMLVGIVRPPEPKGSNADKNGTRKRQYQQAKGRRSKG